MSDFLMGIALGVIAALAILGWARFSTRADIEAEEREDQEWARMMAAERAMKTRHFRFDSTGEIALLGEERKRRVSSGTRSRL